MELNRDQEQEVVVERERKMDERNVWCESAKKKKKKMMEEEEGSRGWGYKWEWVVVMYDVTLE